MMITFLLFAALQQEPDSVRQKADTLAIDTTYLHLLADFPDLATFSYNQITATSSKNVYTEIKNVDVKGCTWLFETWVQQITQMPLAPPRRDGSFYPTTPPSNFYRLTDAIPLNAIDVKRLKVRAALPRAGVTYDPQPWWLWIQLKPKAEAILVGTVDAPHKAKTTSIELLLKDNDSAYLLKEWLADAANRCETWNVKPLKPIN